MFNSKQKNSMKKLNILLITLAALMSFSSCEEDPDLKIAAEIVPPVLESLTPENFVITEGMNLYDKIANWHWKAPEYGFPASVKYTVEGDISAEFAMPFSIGTVKATSIAITGEMLNKAGMAFAEESVPVTLFVRLKAVVDSDEFGAYAPETYSNIQRITFTPYIAEKPLKAPYYIIGNLVQGVPEWTGDASHIGNGLQVFFSDDSNMDNKKYTYTGNFNSGGNFKIQVAAGKWDGAYTFQSAGKLVGENSGGDIPGPSTAGLYTLTIDLIDLTYNFTPYTGETTTYSRIGIIGDATANGWDSDMEMTQITPHIWVMTTDLNAGELKFRANNAWDMSWGGSDIPFGVGNSAPGGSNFSIEKAGTYFLAINDLTGHYIIMRKDLMP